MSGLSDAEIRTLRNSIGHRSSACDDWECTTCTALAAAVEQLLAARAEQIAQQIEAAIEVREYATGLNWKARDAYATAKSIAARIAREGQA